MRKEIFDSNRVDRKLNTLQRWACMYITAFLGHQNVSNPPSYVSKSLNFSIGQRNPRGSLCDIYNCTFDYLLCTNTYQIMNTKFPQAQRRRTFKRHRLRNMARALRNALAKYQ